MYEDLDDWDMLPEVEIAKAKISERFNEIYGSKKETKDIKDMIPKEYHHYLKVFDKEAAMRIPQPTPFDHKINLKEGAKTFKQSPYALNPKQMELAREFIETNLQKGYIVPSKSPMASPLFFVGKKDTSKMRPCQDYRKLNEMTIKDAFPLPDISTLLLDLQGAKYFTKLDLRDGYNNILIKPEDRWKAAFSTPFGHYEPTVMFFGMCNSPATFQRLMNHLLWEQIIRKIAKAYMDDILLFAKTKETLREATHETLTIVEENDLYLKPEKCEFEKEEIKYLGYTISHNRIKMDPKKLAGISDWPSPKTVRQVRSFLGFCNFYRRFIHQFSHTVKPLTTLTKKGLEFKWTDECEQAFQTMKKKFLEAPVLVMPDQDKPFFLETDTSGFATGAVLMQKDDNRHLHPCSYLSRTLSPTEQRYKIYDQELLALVQALEDWRVLLEGARHPITAFTDHDNLRYFRTGQNLNPRQARWSLFLTRFDLKLIHKPGKTMILSDALSRRADAEENKEKIQHATALPDALFIRLMDNEFASFLKKVNNKEYDASALERIKFLIKHTDANDPDWEIKKENGTTILFYQGRRYVPQNPELKRKILQEYHDHPTAGHPGSATTYFLVSRDHWWSGMTSYVKEYVKGCNICQQNKINRRPWNGPLKPLTGPKDPRPFAQMSMDLMTDLPPSEDGYDTLLVVVDHGLSKALVLTPTTKKVTSTGIAELLRDNVYKRFGVSDSIISDRDPRFASQTFQEYLKVLGIQSKMSTAYHPQTDGATERVMQEIQAYLSIYCISNPTDWPNALATLEFVHNSRPHADRKKSPFELIMGYQPHSLPKTFNSTKVPNLDERLKRLAEWRTDAQFAHKIARERMMQRNNKPLVRFTEGQRVWLDTRNMRTTYNKKIRPKREGPFKIKKVLGSHSYQLELPKTWKIHDVFHSVHLSPQNVTPQYGPVKTRPAPDLIDNEEEYEVDHIVRHRKNNKGQWNFLIRWKGFTAEDDTWEPASNLKHAKETLNEYKRVNKLL